MSLRKRCCCRVDSRQSSRRSEREWMDEWIRGARENERIGCEGNVLDLVAYRSTGRLSLRRSVRC